MGGVEEPDEPVFVLEELCLHHEHFNASYLGDIVAHFGAELLAVFLVFVAFDQFFIWMHILIIEINLLWRVWFINGGKIVNVNEVSKTIFGLYTSLNNFKPCPKWVVWTLLEHLDKLAVRKDTHSFRLIFVADDCCVSILGLVVISLFFLHNRFTWCPRCSGSLFWNGRLRFKISLRIFLSCSGTRCARLAVLLLVSLCLFFLCEPLFDVFGVSLSVSYEGTKLLANVIQPHLVWLIHAEHLAFFVRLGHKGSFTTVVKEKRVREQYLTAFKVKTWWQQKLHKLHKVDLVLAKHSHVSLLDLQKVFGLLNLYLTDWTTRGILPIILYLMLPCVLKMARKVRRRSDGKFMARMLGLLFDEARFIHLVLTTSNLASLQSGPLIKPFVNCNTFVHKFKLF